MSVVAIETYLITALVPMKPQQQANINATITVGYITSLIFGLAFGYFGRNFVFHGLFITGQALVFFAGLQLAVGAVAVAQGVSRDRPGLRAYPRRR